MKYAILIIIPFLFLQAHTQNLISTNPARLQVYLKTANGDQVMLICNELNNQFNGLNMAGTLDMSSLATDEAGIKAILDSLEVSQISYSTTIPEGQFIFRDTYNNTFNTESELIYGDKTIRFMLNFNISNRKTSLANTFAVTCSGNLSLKNDLGIMESSSVLDEVNFQFYQNVQSLDY